MELDCKMVKISPPQNLLERRLPVGESLKKGQLAGKMPALPARRDNFALAGGRANIHHLIP